MTLTEQEVQDLIADPKLCRPYDLVRGAEAVLLHKLETEQPNEAEEAPCSNS